MVSVVVAESTLGLGTFTYIVVGEDKAVFDSFGAAVLGVEPGFVLGEGGLEQGPWRTADEFLGLW